MTIFISPSQLPYPPPAVAEVRAASWSGDYGRDTEPARMGRRMTQTRLGHVPGLSQPAVSRPEKRGTRP
ncbi:hypothetical protein ACIRFH_10295 [Streptomyces sp. NPDC093586]|uniref:hypothetical protein n=1 Tax=Streptomyces sp. NPDC093586 TaxID=3366042 RepID=UPI0038087173